MKKSCLIIALLLGISTSFASNNTYKISCGGTEPFWSLKIDGNFITYKSQEALDDMLYEDAKMIEAAGMSSGVAFQINATAKLGTSNLSLSIIQADGVGCNDGMSDLTYKYHVLVNLNGIALYGCCK